MTIAAKTATDPDAFRAPTLFYSSARRGFADLLQHLHGSRRGVLLPAYIGWSPREGSGVLDPVNASDRPRGFYGLDDNLTVDLDSLKANLASGEFGLVVLIHYFGRTDPHTREVADMVRRHDAILMEDLAHGFFSAARGDAGGCGDVSLFSLHKMFPFGEGGMIRYRNASLVRGQKDEQPEFGRLILDQDWRGIAERRLSNAHDLLSQLRGVPGFGEEVVPLWTHLAEGDVPQTLPVRLLRHDRNEVYRLMNADGVGMVSLYHTLEPQVRGLYPQLDRLSETILNFPVHQDIESTQASRIVDVFAKALERA